MIDQLSFFDHVEEPKPTITEAKPINKEDWCLIYLVTRSGGNQGNIWILKRDDAIKFCSDPCSCGIGRGGPWIMMWTSMDHFIQDDAGAKQHKDVHGKLTPFKFIYDTGKQDKDFERLGIDKPGIKEISELLQSMGYLMEFEGNYERKKRKAEDIKTITEGE